MSALGELIDDAETARGSDWNGSEYELLWSSKDIAEARAELAALRERGAKLEAVEAAAFQLTRWDSDHLIEPGPRGDQLVTLIRALDKVVRAARESTKPKEET